MPVSGLITASVKGRITGQLVGVDGGGAVIQFTSPFIQINATVGASVDIEIEPWVAPTISINSGCISVSGAYKLSTVDIDIA